MTTLFVLLVVFQLKHFLADYPLQGKYMLGKFKPGWEFLGPLAAHAGVHALLTWCIASVVIGRGEWAGGLAEKLALMDFVVHFTMDRIKAGPKYLGRFKDMMRPYFWWCLGFDQMVHHLTHYAIIYFLLTRV